MLKTAVSLALCLVLSSLAAADQDGRRSSAGARPPAGSTVRIISSSHQDIAWMNSPEACREYRDTHCITPALEMMAANPDYCFVMENMLNLMEYLERHPERRDDILQLHPRGTDGMGSDLQPALRVPAQRRAARPRRPTSAAAG